MPAENTVSKNNMALASLLCGIIAVLPVCFSALSFICGALGIIFALLSRRDGPLHRYALIGLILSAAGLIVTVAMFAVTLYTLYSSGLLAQAQDIYNSIDWTSDNAMADFYSQIQSAVSSYYSGLMP